jgi:hypothetical protein
MNLSGLSALLAGVVLLAGCAGVPVEASPDNPGVGASVSSEPNPASSEPSLEASRSVFPVTMDEYYATWSVQDWVNLADYVALVKVVGEAPEKQAKAEGEGFDLVGRTVTVEVEQTLWESSFAPQQLPGSIDFTALGTMVDETGVEYDAIMNGSSRFEVGHEYVVALVWIREQCSDQDGDTPAHWAYIGSGGVLPADGGMVGAGEFEGRIIDAAEAAKVAQSESVLAQFAGKPADGLTEVLTAANVNRIDYLDNPKSICPT